MINGGDLYNVMTAVVPLYVAMILAYGSVKWWKIFTPDQCAGINRFVALFAVPLLSFHFISTNNPYTMNFKFIAADSLQKVMILAMLSVWTLVSKSGSLDWMITLFSLSTLPNTLVMGIPLLKAMYGDFSGDLMVQVVVLQCIVWYTLMLFMFEYRGAKLLIMEQFPDTGASIVSFRVDSDVVSLDGREPLQADTEIGDDGRLHVTVRKSTSCRSISHTPRPSNMSNAEIYSNPTPRGSSFNHADFYSMFNNKSPRHSNFGPQDSIYSVHSSKVPTPRTSNFDEDAFRASNSPRLGLGPPMYSYPHQTQRGSASVGNGLELSGAQNGNAAVRGHKRSCDPRSSKSVGEENKDLHMFVWSTSASPVSEAATAAHHTMFSVNNTAPHLRHASCDAPPSRGMFTASPIRPRTPNSRGGEQYEEYYYPDEFTFGNNRGLVPQDGLLNQHGANNRDSPLTPTPTNLTKLDSTSSTTQLHPKGTSDAAYNKMPPASVMTRLILIMVWRKLIRNPNTYSSLFGLSWALITFRWNIQMPKIIEGSIRILSDAGLGMAMFSLGLFMALQPKIIACGNSVAAFAMAVRFLTGPAVMAAASIAVGLRGVLLHVGIVQAALPQGIVPFVFAKEYNLHPDILSTAVIFGMLIALPITLVYYVLLGL